MTSRDLLLSKRVPNNPFDQQAAVQRAVSELANREIEVPQLSGIATDFGLINAGTIVMGNGQPLGSGFTGTMRFADPLEWPSGSGNFWTELGFQSDIMMYGISAADGSVYAAGGLLSLYNRGISLTGPVGLVNFQSVWGQSVFSGGMGFALVNGALHPTPYWALTNDRSLDGTNLIANGDFETGDLTGWTASTTSPGSATVGSVSIFSKYALILGKPSTAAAASVVSNRVTSGVTGGKGYVISFIAVRNVVGGTGRVEVRWYDSASGGTLLRTDSMPVTLLIPGTSLGQVGWGQHVAHLVSPDGALSFEVACLVGTGGSTPFGDVYVDNVTIHESSVQEMLLLRETGPVYSRDGVEMPAVPDYKGYATYNSDSSEKSIYTRSLKAGSTGITGTTLTIVTGYALNSTGSSKTARYRGRIGGLAGTIFFDTGDITLANGQYFPFVIIISHANQGAADSPIFGGWINGRAFGGGTTAGAPSLTGMSLSGNAANMASDQDLVVTSQLSASSASLTSVVTGAWQLGPYHD